jgi:serine O-acetyltransferase
MDHTNIPDPVLDRFEALERELIELRKQVESHNPSEKQ